MIFVFFSGSDAFDNRFFLMGCLRIKFQVKPFFHGPDNEEAGTPVKNNAVWGGADHHFGPVGNFGQNFIKNENEFFGTACEKRVETDTLAIMPEICPG